MKKLVAFFVFSMCSVSVFGQEEMMDITPFDSTRFYRRQFSDRSEFDIRGFKRFPPLGKVYDSDIWEIISGINPIPGYVYWECRYSTIRWQDDLDDVIAYKGDKEHYGYLAMQYVGAQKESFYPGFFMGCAPLICYYYIVAVREDETVELINDEKKLIEFMGDVDNIEEVLLHIEANGYWYDENTPIGGAYKEEDDRYLLYLLEYSEWPVTYKSVKAILYKDGRFEVVNKVTYKMLNEYWES